MNFIALLTKTRVIETQAAAHMRLIHADESFDGRIRTSYSEAMSETKQETVYFGSDIHLALTRKAAESAQSISQVVNEAVRLALAEDEKDLRAFRERSDEPNLDFVDVVKSLKRRGKL